MPQLDVPAYFSQVILVSFVFFVFYRVVVSALVPLFSRILKGRVLRVAKLRGQTAPTSESTAVSGYDGLVGGFTLGLDSRHGSALAGEQASETLSYGDRVLEATLPLAESLRLGGDAARSQVVSSASSSEVSSQATWYEVSVSNKGQYFW